MEIKKIYSDRAGHFILEFGDENYLSILFGNVSHTENHEFPSHRALDSDFDFEKWLTSPVDSTTLEIMPGGERITKIVENYGKEYWDGVLLNYYPVSKLFGLLEAINCDREE